MTSSMAESTATYAASEKFLMISPTIATEALSKKDDYFLRLIPSTKEQAKRIGQAINQGETGQVLILYSSQNSAFSDSLSAALRDMLRMNNVRSVELANGPNHLVDYENLFSLELFKEANNIVLIASADMVSTFAQNMAIQKIEKNIYLPAWAMTNDLLQVGGPTVEGFYGVNFIDHESKNPKYLEFQKKYEGAYGQKPTFASILSYEAVMVIASAMKDGGIKDSTELKEAILTQKEFEGLQETFRFDQYGDVKRSDYLYRIENQKFVKVEGNL